jgi:hypothetical protein
MLSSDFYFLCILTTPTVFITKVKQAYDIIILSVCPTFKLLNQLTDFHKSWYECYATGDYSNLMHFNFLQYVITTRQTCELGSAEQC